MRVELVRVVLPLVQPHVAAHGREDDRDVVLVRVVRADGAEGWGECSALSHPGYTHEHTATAWAALRDDLAPAVLAGGHGDRLGHPMAAAALDVAAADAAARARGAGWREVLCVTEATTSVAHHTVVGMVADVDGLRRRVDAEVAGGAAAIVVKVAGRGSLRAVGAVRADHPDLALAIDANGSFGPDDVAELTQVDEWGLVYVEQPLPVGAVGPLADLCRRIRTPVALDEGVASAAAARRALTLGVRVLNVKPARLGGLTGALAVRDEAVASGASALVGGMLETGVGRSLAVRLAAAPGFDLPTAIGPSDCYFAQDVTEPVVAAGPGRVALPEGPGLVCAPEPDRLRAVAVDRVDLRALDGRLAAVRLARVGVAVSGWDLVEAAGAAGALHAWSPPGPLDRGAWRLEPDRPALVLGSAPGAAGPAGDPPVEVVRRRSGGGAVLLEPGRTLWVDVWLPRDDPLWSDDVGRSFGWLGHVWVEALARLGVEAAVHDGPAERDPAARAVCFAGLGPGEALAGGRKVVGLSQRRGAWGARFQCVLYTGAVGEVVPTPELELPPVVAAEVARRLHERTDTVPASPQACWEAFVAALP